MTRSLHIPVILLAVSLSPTAAQQPKSSGHYELVANWGLAPAGEPFYSVSAVVTDPKGTMTLGTYEVAGEGPNAFNRPADVAVAINGDFFVSDGHGNSRVAKFTSDGQKTGPSRSEAVTLGG